MFYHELKYHRTNRCGSTINICCCDVYQGTMVLQNKHGYFQIDEGNRTKRMKSRLENLMKDK